MNSPLDDVQLNGLLLRFCSDRSLRLPSDLSTVRQLSALMRETHLKQGEIAALAELVALSIKVPLLPEEDDRTNFALAVFAVRYALGNGDHSVLDENSSINSLPDLWQAAEAGDSAEIAELLETWLIVAETDESYFDASLGLGMTVELVAAVSHVDGVSAMRVAPIVESCAKALERVSFTVNRPNQHVLREHGPEPCHHSTNFDLMVVVGEEASWRGGEQVRRAHAMLKPVIIVLRGGTRTTCLFTDPAAGLTLPVRYATLHSLAGILLDMVDSIVVLLNEGRSTSLERAERHRVAYEETLARFHAYASRTTVELGAMTDAQARRILESVEAFGASSLSEIDHLRRHVGLEPIHSDWFDFVRRVLTDRHLDALDAFVSQRSLAMIEEIELHLFVVSELVAAHTDRHRSRKYFTQADLDHGLQAIRAVQV